MQHKKSQKNENLQQIKVREKLLIDRCQLERRKVEEIEQRAILFLDQNNRILAQGNFAEITATARTLI